MSGKPMPTGRADGWKNLLTGLGTARDKRLGAQYAGASRFHQQELEELYRGNHLASRIIDTLPEEMCREGFELRNPDSKWLAEDIMATVDELELLSYCLTGLEWARAYGGAGIVMGINEGRKTDPEQPVNESRIQSIDWLHALTPQELQVVEWYRDADDRKFGQPKSFRLVPLVPSALPMPWQIVHESRVLRFPGVLVSNRQVLEFFNYGHGDSVLVRSHEVIRDFDTNWANAAALIQDFAQAVWKLKGLNKLIGDNKNKVIQDRIAAADLSRSTVRALLLDAEDDYDRKTTPMAGLSDIIEKFMLRMASAADMPVSLLMGQSPAGLNATGDSDIRFWYMKVGAAQRKKLKPLLNRFLHLLLKSKRGPTKGVEPRNWSITFPSLWQLTAVEQSTVRLNTSQADASDISSGVLLPEEVATSRFGGDEYSADTVLDQELRKQKAAEPPPEAPPPTDPSQAPGMIPAPGEKAKPIPPLPVPKPSK